MMQYGTAWPRISLGTRLHSTRPEAARASGAAARRKSQKTAKAAVLFIAQRVDGIEPGGTGSRIKAGHETDKDGKSESAHHQPPRHGRKFYGIQALPLQVQVRAEGDGTAEQPAESDAKNPAEKPHHARFDEEELLHIGIRGAQRFQNADLPPALENGHHQCVDNAEGGHGQREAAEDPKQQIENGEKGAERFGSVEERKRIEAEIADGDFQCLDMGR